MCNGDPVKYNFLINWLGYFVRFPAKKTKIGLVFVGATDTQKAIFIKILHAIGGRYVVEETSMSLNIDLTTLIFNDFCWHFKYAFLENMITKLNQPNVAPIVTRNPLNVIIFSNEKPSYDGNTFL